MAPLPERVEEGRPVDCGVVADAEVVENLPLERPSGVRLDVDPERGPQRFK